VVRFTLPAQVARYVVEKGSITVDGVSLTVSALDDRSFSVSLIPTTLGLTTLGHKGVGDPVNLEVDVIAKYVERLLAPSAAGAASAATIPSTSAAPVAPTSAAPVAPTHAAPAAPEAEPTA